MRALENGAFFIKVAESWLQAVLKQLWAAPLAALQRPPPRQCTAQAPGSSFYAPTALSQLDAHAPIQ